MKTKDLLKYFLSESFVLTIEDETKCGKSCIRQVKDEFDCCFSEIFISSALVAGDYLVTFKPRGVKPNFTIITDDGVQRYFTLIEEE